jgi:hypothetical protein
MKKSELAARSMRLDQFQPPFYPLFIRVMYLLFGSKNFKAVTIVQSIASAITIPLLFLLALHIATPSAAYAAGAIGIVYPNFSLHNLALLESSFGILLITALMLIMLFECEEKHRAIAAAVTIGCGIMLMPVFLYLVPGLLFVLEKRKIFILTLVIMLLPLFIHNIKLHRKFVPLFHRWTWAVNLRMYQHEGAHIIEKIYRNAASLFRHPSTTAFHGKVDRVYLTIHYVSYYSYITVLITGLIGLIRCFRSEHEKIVVPIAGYVLLLILIGRFDLEYRVLIEPFAVLFLAILIGDRLIPASSADQYGGIHDEGRFYQNT